LDTALQDTELLLVDENPPVQVEIEMTGTQGSLSIREILTTPNLAEILSESKLAEIGKDVVDGYHWDLESRETWDREQREILKLARLDEEVKNEPHENAANVKFPMVTQSCIQFSSRVLSNLIKENRIAHGKVLTDDPGGVLKAKANAMAGDLSNVFLEEMPGWIDDTDQLFTEYPMRGCGFRKIWYDSAVNRPDSEYVEPTDLVIDYHSRHGRDMERAERVTHRFTRRKNEIVERIRRGIYRNIDLDKIDTTPSDEDLPRAEQRKDEDSSPDPKKPILLLEQCCWIDLDGDGYDEPYIALVQESDATVFRITKRFDEEDVDFAQDGTVLGIKPFPIYVRYLFFKALDGSFYGSGFGQVQGPINRSVNSAMNALFDAAYRQNAGGGLYLRGAVTTKTGEIPIKPGVFSAVDSPFNDISKAFYPFPTPNPPPMLEKLLEILIDAGDRLGSPEILTGVNPGSNTPVGTVLAMVEQGMQVYGAVFIRLFGSLRKEFYIVRELCRRHYMEMQAAGTIRSYFSESVGAITAEDYADKKVDFVPVADPKQVTDLQKMLVAESLGPMLGKGLNDDAIMRYVLQARGVPNIEEIIPQGGYKTPADPKVQLEAADRELQQMKMEIQNRLATVKEHEMAMDLAVRRQEAAKIANEATRALSEAIKNIALAEAAEAGPQLEMYKNYVEELKVLTSQIAPQGAGMGDQRNAA